MRSTITLYSAGSFILVPPSFTNSAATPSFLPISFTRAKNAGGNAYSRPHSNPIFFMGSLLRRLSKLNSPRAPTFASAPSLRRAFPSQCAAPLLSNRRFVRRRAVAAPRSCLRATWCLRTPPRSGFPDRPQRRPPAPVIPGSTPASALLLLCPSQSAFLQFRSAPRAICSLQSGLAGRAASSDCFCTAYAASQRAPASGPQSPRLLPLSLSRRTSETRVCQKSDAALRPTKFSCQYQCSSASPANSQNSRTRSMIRTAPESPSAEISGTPSFETISIPCSAPSRTANSSKEPASEAGSTAPCSSCRSSFACPASPRECACQKSAATAPVAAALPQCADNALPAKLPGQSSWKMDVSPPPPLAIPRVPPLPRVLRVSGAFPRVSPRRSRKFAFPFPRSTGASRALPDPRSQERLQIPVASHANAVRRWQGQ